MKKDWKFFEVEVIPLKQMLHCATNCMIMPEVASAKHAISFISNFLIVSRESHYLVSIANEVGEGIFKQVLYYFIMLRLFSWDQSDFPISNVLKISPFLDVICS